MLLRTGVGSYKPVAARGLGSPALLRVSGGHLGWAELDRRPSRGQFLPVRAASMWFEKALSKVKPGKKSTPGTSSSGVTFSDSAPSWAALSEMLAAKQLELGIDPSPDLINGPNNHFASQRLFGKGRDPEVVLYRDTAAWCPYCQKIWMQLEEKQIPYRVERINMRCYGDKPGYYLQMMPSGQVPVAEVGGRIAPDSGSIQRVLEERYPERPLLPKLGTPERERADALNRLERTLFGAWMQWLTSSWGHERAKQEFCRALDAVEQHLSSSQGPYFMGSDISLVDLNFTPFLERMVASLLYYKGFMIRDQQRYPGICRWFDALETRPSYMGTRGDFYSHVHDLPPQLGGCASHPDGEEAAAAIDGTDGKSWHLPLSPLSASSSPEPYAVGDNAPVDMTEAAAKLISNHENVVKFAARGCGKPGNKPVSARLSDPTAQPGLEHVPAVDAALRHVAHALLTGVEAKQTSTDALQAVENSTAEGFPAEAVIVSAEYLRDRVGVPRDLKLPAARQLRAHLNWLVDSLAL